MMGTPLPDNTNHYLDAAASNPEESAGEDFSKHESLVPLNFLTQEIIAYMGPEFVKAIPLDVLEKYCMQSIDLDHPTGKMLLTIITNFMRAYGRPEFSDKAMEAFDYLDYVANTESPKFE